MTYYGMTLIDLSWEEIYRTLQDTDRFDRPTICRNLLDPLWWWSTDGWLCHEWKFDRPIWARFDDLTGLFCSFNGLYRSCISLIYCNLVDFICINMIIDKKCDAFPVPNYKWWRRAGRVVMKQPCVRIFGWVWLWHLK